ncbi:MAG TPA: alanine--tRNA ligase, partial [Planctomycetota bacterium]|nr:alanine--tRNA ligase [Planctomycetota bacterium]
DAKENYWPANAPADGPNGPCGPCSEFFYDQGEAFGCGKPGCDPSCSCDRYVEFYNCVFTQFDRQPDGTLVPLPGKNVDTGMGLERTLAVMHGAPNNFETPLFLPVIERTCELSGRKYVTRSDDGRRMRRIVDHARAVTFCIGDGVLPSNEGRGYVVRRLLRVATIDGRALGIDGAFLYQLVPVIASVMAEPYPEVAGRRETLARIIKAEEEKFASTLEAGERLLRELEDDFAASGKKRLPGAELFRLFDTFGIPAEVAALRLKVTDETRREFAEAMERQRKLARGGSAMSEHIFITGALGKIRDTVPGTKFDGYDKVTLEAAVQALIRDNALLDEAKAGDEDLTVVLDRTPFYAEQGGQVGDTGVLRTKSAEFRVTDTRLSPPHTLHLGKIVKGTLKAGDTVEASVDAERRSDVMRNHTATHLLHAALRETLGEHAEQSGSLVAPDHLRFDFHHFEAPSRVELEKIERIVNERILENTELTHEVMDLSRARETGAKALFGEKYGSEVRVVTAGDFSKELCGGTHCRRTGDIGQFKIIGEESVAAGIRRITALTGRQALVYWNQTEDRLREAAAELKAPVGDVVKRVQTLSRELKETRRELDRLKSGERSSTVADLVAQAPTVGGVKLVTGCIEGLSAAELRSAVDVVRRTGEEAAAVLASVEADKVALIAYAGEKARSAGLDAGKLIKEVAKVVDGGGGGRPELAQAGGTNPSKVNEALELAKKLMTKNLA